MKIVYSELLSTRWTKKVEVQRLSSRIYWLAIEITIQLVRILAFLSYLFSLRQSVCPSYFWVLFFHIKSDNCRKLIVFVLIKTEPLSHYINVNISLNVFYFICVVISAVESGAFPMSAIFSGIFHSNLICPGILCGEHIMEAFTAAQSWRCHRWLEAIKQFAVHQRCW